MGKRIAIILLLLVLILIVISKLNINDEHSFLKGQEKEYLNWCFENENNSIVKTPLSIFDYGEEELYFYLSKNDSFCYVYLDCKNNLQWEEHGTVDLNKAIDSNEPIVISSNQSSELFEVFLKSSVDFISDTIKCDEISFTVNNKEYSITILVKHDYNK